MIYEIDNFEVNSLSWYDYWSQSSDNFSDIEFAELLPLEEFYPAVRLALIILLTLPVTTSIKDLFRGNLIFSRKRKTNNIKFIFIHSSFRSFAEHLQDTVI